MNTEKTKMKMQRKLEEAYKHIEPHLKEKDILKDMCKHCERYCENQHNYKECLDMPCFKCFLGYSYLEWATSWE